jgi:putative hydrolase of the HAD superfamily
MDYAKNLKEKGLKVFVLSNNFKERTTYYRQNFPEIFKDLNNAYFSWETGFVKPNPEAFQKILNDNGLIASECLYFDDSGKNIEVAKELGIHSEIYDGFDATKNIIEKITSSKTVEKK